MLILLLFFTLFPAGTVQAGGQPQKFIKIDYIHSLRIPHQNIFIELFTDTQDSEIYRMKIETKAMVFSETNWDLNDVKTRNYIESEEYKKSKEERARRFEYYGKMNINKVVTIEKEYFENIFNRLFEIDIKKIIEEYNPREPAADGSSANIQFGTSAYFISIAIGEPGSGTGEKGKADQIIKELFERADLLEYYE
jgi:hypothetical protein